MNVFYRTVRYVHEDGGRERDVGAFFYAPDAKYMGLFMDTDHAWLADAFPGFNCEGFRHRQSRLIWNFMSVVGSVGRGEFAPGPEEFAAVCEAAVLGSWEQLRCGPMTAGVTDDAVAEFEAMISRQTAMRTADPAEGSAEAGGSQ